jgi:pyrroline-5-carboxylate reductase
MAPASSDSDLSRLSGPIVLIGGGKMGGALLDGWLRLGLSPRSVAVIDPAPSEQLLRLQAEGLRLNPETHSLHPATMVVVAVKPQVADAVVPTLKPLAGPDTLVISVMAGRTIGFLEAATPESPVIRSMPNTPAAVGRGITVAVANKRVSQGQRQAATGLLEAVGAVEWVEDESLLDAVTAVSGSGPAYVFLLAESLARAGAAAGLPGPLAARLARATVSGAGELLWQSELDPAQLRANVTSPAGTTAAALSVLMAEDGLDPLLRKAVEAAAQRSRELAAG